MTLGFTSLTSEVSNASLDVLGSLPEWLEGILVRNGPALFEVGSEQVRHWFDGLSMLHRFTFADGAISYSNRFLESKAYLDARDKGRITHRDFATDPPRSYLRRITSPPTDNCDVNIIRVGGAFIAITETVKMYEFRPDDLGTVGRFRYERGQ